MCEENKALVRRYMERSVNEEDAESLDELTTPDYVGHMTGVPPFDRTMHRQLLQQFRAAFPDLHVEIEDMVAEGDQVVHRSTYSGTHRGEFQGIPASGKSFSITGINISRIVDGKVAEDWTVIDMLSMLQQIGAMPTAAAAGS